MRKKDFKTFGLHAGYLETQRLLDVNLSCRVTEIQKEESLLQEQVMELNKLFYLVWILMRWRRRKSDVAEIFEMRLS